MLKENLVFNLLEPGNIQLIPTTISPNIKNHYTRIKVDYCGICGTDLSFYHGHRVEEYPICLGHEHCGTVIETGENADKFKKGDFVAIDPNYRCGNCDYCKNKLGHLCEQFACNLFSSRGYANFIDIHESYLRLLPNFKSRFHGALVEPLSVAVHAIDVSEVEKSESPNILILGVGALGSLLAFSLLSIFENISISIFDINEKKMQALKSIYGNRIQCLDDVNKHQSSFNYVYEVTGHSSGFYSACKALSKAGNLILVSRYHSCEPKIPDRLPWKAPIIRLVHLNGNGESMKKASDLLINYWSESHDTLLYFYKFEDIATAFAEYEKNDANKKIVYFDEI